ATPCGVHDVDPRQGGTLASGLVHYDAVREASVNRFSLSLSEPGRHAGGLNVLSLQDEGPGVEIPDVLRTLLGLSLDHAPVGRVGVLQYSVQVVTYGRLPAGAARLRGVGHQSLISRSTSHRMRRRPQAMTAMPMGRPCSRRTDISPCLPKSKPREGLWPRPG